GAAQRGDGEAVARPGGGQRQQESAGCQLTHLQHILDKTFHLALYMRWLSLQDQRGLDAPEVTMGDVRVESEGSITTIWMDRPERRNAVDGAMAADQRAAVEGFGTDPAHRIAMLASTRGTLSAAAML